GQDVEIYVVGNGNLLHVHAEHFLAAAHIRQADNHAAVEAPGAKERRVQHVGPVGGCDENDAVVRFEAVHLDQELLQGLLALVVAAAQASAATAADRVDFVDADDAGRILLA